MTYRLITAPTSEPVTLSEAKDHLVVSGAADDGLITGYIKAARTHVEHITGLQLMPATWELVLDRFPADGIEIYKAPVSAVSSISYTDTAGDTQTWDSDDYQTDTDSIPTRIIPTYGETFPIVRADTLNAVVVRFVAGYADAATVPENIKLAIKICVAEWYMQREPIVIGQSVAEVPGAVAKLVANNRAWRF